MKLYQLIMAMTLTLIVCLNSGLCCIREYFIVFLIEGFFIFSKCFIEFNYHYFVTSAANFLVLQFQCRIRPCFFLF